MVCLRALNENTKYKLELELEEQQITNGRLGTRLLVDGVPSRNTNPKRNKFKVVRYVIPRMKQNISSSLK